MILDFSSKYNNSITYYGIGFFWSSSSAPSIPVVGGVTARYRTLLGVGV